MAIFFAANRGVRGLFARSIQHPTRTLNHEQLWAPWRLGYVTGEKKAPPIESGANWLAGADRSCFLCQAVAGGPPSDKKNLVVLRSTRTVVVLNRFPYNNGHLLVSPVEHLPGLVDLSEAHHAEGTRIITDMTVRLKRLLNAEGFNIGLNLGRMAGAGVPGHLHWHVVPRWSGDTNFMPVLAGVDLIPQSLDALWEILVADYAANPPR